jgi:hypothetical protein
MAKSLPCVAHGKRHSVNRCWQRGHLSCAIYQTHGKESFQKTDFKNRKQKRYNSGRTPPAPPKLQVITFFAHHAVHEIRTHDLSLTCNLYHYTTQSLYTPFSFPTYYTKPSVYCLRETLNEFKFKNCQLQSFITFRDLQLLFW